MQNQQNRPFDRLEAFALLQLFAGDTCAPVEDVEKLIDDAVVIAQSFDERCRGASSQQIHPATISGGQYAPYGKALYFITHDGSQYWQGDYPTMEACIETALALNSYLPFSSEKQYDGIPKNLP